MDVKMTKDIKTTHVMMIVYGAPGAGKTRLIQTLENPFIISAEGGLLSLDIDIPYVEVNDVSDFAKAIAVVKQAIAQGYKSVAVDSLSELAEIALAHEKEQTKDGRQAYGQMADKVKAFIRDLRRLPVDVVMTAKINRDEDNNSKKTFAPFFPGQILPRDVTHQVDQIFCLRKSQAPDGTHFSTLMCNTDGFYEAKDRSNVCEMWEAPDLGDIIRRVKEKKGLE